MNKISQTQTQRTQKFDELLKQDLTQASQYARQIAEYYTATIQQEQQNDKQSLTTYENILKEVNNQQSISLEEQYKQAQVLESQNKKDIELIMNKNIDFIY